MNGRHESLRDLCIVLMQFWSDVGLEPTAKTEFLKYLVILLKHRDRIPGQEELPLDLEERLMIYLGVGGSKVQRKFPVIFSYAKKDLQGTGGLGLSK